MCGRRLAYPSAAPAARSVSTARHSARFREAAPDEDRLTADIIELATQYGRYGYRPVTALLNQAGWHVNHKRVERIWQREGLKVPPKQKKRSRLWLNDGSCIRLRPERPNHVWSYDFVQDRTHDGRPYRILVILDEFTREALMLRVDRKLNSTDVLDALTDLFILRGPPDYIRSDNERLPRRALPSRNDLFHSKHRVRATAALTVLNTRSQIPSRRPEHYLRGQRAASTAHVRERSFRLGSPPQRRGDRVRRD
jgi:putative transposase